MHSFFHYDGVVIQTMNKVADCICLSFLWLLSAIPLITIGPATTALYYSVNKCIRRSEGGVWRTYWHSFRANFRQSLLLGLILLPLYGLLCASCYSAYLLGQAGTLPTAMFYFLLFVTAAFTIWASLLFPYLARFQNRIPVILKNCVFIALMHFPVGLLHLVLVVLAAGAVVFFPLAIVCAPGVYMVLSCYALEPVFRKYMTEEDRAREDARDQE